MKISKISHKIILSLFVTLIICLCASQTVFSQTEKLGIVSYTAPKGWSKTTKENIVAFTQVNQSTGAFCIITLYGATPGTGDPKSDFKREWNNLVVKVFKAEANPETETETIDGWTVIGGGAAVESDGIKSGLFLTVYSRGGRTVSLLGLFNDKSYAPQIAVFSSSLDLGKAIAETPAPQPEVSLPAAPSGNIETMNAAPLQYDAYGHLLIPPPTRQLTLADLGGQWGESDGINTRYVYRDSGTYAGADSLHYKSKMTFTADGGYYDDFYAIQNGKMIKEKTAGAIAVNGRILVIKDTNLRKFVIRGWLELPDMTILEVCGPWYNDDVIPQEIFTNPAQGANLDKKWFRKK